MNRVQQIALIVGLAGWIGLGLAHVAIVMLGPKGWRADRSAPGATAVVGHPHDTDPRAVAGPRALATHPDVGDSARLVVLLPAATDSADLLYVRYQLAHVLYPRRVVVRRIVEERPLPQAIRRSDALVAAPGVPVPPACRVSASAFDHDLLECPPS